MASSPREQLVTLASFTPRIVRSVWVGGVVLALGLAGTAAWALSTKRLYRSEAVVVYEHGVQPAALGGESDSPRQVSARFFDALSARHRMEAVIKKLNLYPAIVDRKNIVEAIDEMRKHLNFTGRESYTYRVAFDGDSRELAQKALDNLIKDVVQEDLDRRGHDADETRKFLDAERKRADGDVKTKESALSLFLTQHPQFASETGGSATTGVSLRAIERERPAGASGGGIASLEMQAAQLEEALLGAGRRPEILPGEEPSMAAARARAHADLAAAQQELQTRQAHFTNEHPDVKSALRRVSEAESAVRRVDAAAAAAMPRGVVPAAGADLEGGRSAGLKRALAAVRSQIGSLRSRGSAPRGAEIPRTSPSMVAIDTEWTRLNREVGEAHERQGQLESKQFQAQLNATLVGAGQGARLVVADPPFRPLRPVAGGRSKVALIGGALSLMLALLAVSARAALDDRLYGARDVERVVDDPIVIVVPKLTEKGG